MYIEAIVIGILVAVMALILGVECANTINQGFCAGAVSGAGACLAIVGVMEGSCDILHTIFRVT